MSWTRTLPEPIALKDGRKIATLNQAREVMLAIPLSNRRFAVWRFAAQRLEDACGDERLLQEAGELLTRALKVEGLI